MDLKSVKNFITDMDGVLIKGRQIIPGQVVEGPPSIAGLMGPSFASGGLMLTWEPGTWSRFRRAETWAGPQVGMKSAAAATNP